MIWQDLLVIWFFSIDTILILQEKQWQSQKEELLEDLNKVKASRAEMKQKLTQELSDTKARVSVDRNLLLINSEKIIYTEIRNVFRATLGTGLRKIFFLVTKIKIFSLIHRQDLLYQNFLNTV